MEAAARDKPAAALSADATGALATFAVLLAEQGDALGAFAASERMRAIDLRASLAVNERDIARDMSAEEREEERTLAITVSTYLARIAREKGLPKPDTARITALQQSLDEATAQRRAWMARLFERLPDLAAWRGLARADAAPDLQALVPAERSLLLSFVLDEEALLILTVAPAPVAPETDAAAPRDPVCQAFVVPIKRRQVAGMSAAITQAVLSDGIAWKKSASALSALFPSAVTDFLARANTVAIVPHDVLWRVPFDALPAGDGYLSERRRIVVAGSAAMLTRAAAITPAGASGVALVGVPQLTPARIDWVRQVAPAWSLRSEADAAKELQTAGTDPAPTTTLTGAAATEPAVRDAIGRAGILHVAAPFRINAASPLFSSVLLSSADAPPAAPPPAATDTSPAQAAESRPPARADSANDGALELREVMNLTAAARVAMLTDGTATAMRDSAAAADVVEWGWLAAGVPSILIARWAAPPDSRDRLLTELHERLRAASRSPTRCPTLPASRPIHACHRRARPLGGVDAAGALRSTVATAAARSFDRRPGVQELLFASRTAIGLPAARVRTANGTRSVSDRPDTLSSNLQYLLDGLAINRSITPNR